MAAYYNEVDAFCCEWLRNLIRAGLIAPGDVDERDIRDVQASDLVGYDQCHFFAGVSGWSLALRLAGWPDDQPVWTGSCPCQPFSVAGAGKGEADERHLWPDFRRLIEDGCPPVVFGEQVASKAGRDWLAAVRADLEALAYAVGAADLCSAGAGATDLRQRLYWVADAAGQRRTGERLLLRPEATGRLEGAISETARGGEAGRVADAEVRGQRIDGGTSGLSRHADERGEARGLAEPDGGRCAAGRLRGRRKTDEGRTGEAVTRHGGACGLADTNGTAQSDGRVQRSGRLLQPAADPAVGFWDACDWVPCRDGYYRPVEPGTFPLDTGIPARVGRLRAYGNAINVRLAAHFISAYCEVTR